MATKTQVLKLINLLNKTREKLEATRMKRKHVIQPIRNGIDYISIVNEADNEADKQGYYFTEIEWALLRAETVKLWTYADDVEDEAHEQLDLDDARHLLNLSALRVITERVKEMTRKRVHEKNCVSE
jgi:hypothetical protein